MSKKNQIVTTITVLRATIEIYNREEKKNFYDLTLTVKKEMFDLFVNRLGESNIHLDTLRNNQCYYGLEFTKHMGLSIGFVSYRQYHNEQLTFEFLRESLHGSFINMKMPIAIYNGTDFDKLSYALTEIEKANQDISNVGWIEFVDKMAEIYEKCDYWKGGEFDPHNSYGRELLDYIFELKEDLVYDIDRSTFESPDNYDMHVEIVSGTGLDECVYVVWHATSIQPKTSRIDIPYFQGAFSAVANVFGSLPWTDVIDNFVLHGDNEPLEEFHAAATESNEVDKLHFYADMVINGDTVTFITPTSRRVITVTKENITINFPGKGSTVAANDVMSSLVTLYPNADAVITDRAGGLVSLKDRLQEADN